MSLYNRPSLPGSSDTSLIIEAWLLLWGCRIALWCVTFPRVLKLAQFCAEPRSTSRYLSAEQAVRCIHRALRFTWRASCLTQALAGWIMLTRHGTDSRINIGVVSPQERAFSAHAWLQAGERVILGDTDLAPFHVIWTLPPE